MSLRTFRFMVPAGFDWSKPASGEVINISTNTLNSVYTAPTIVGGAAQTTGKNIYRDSGIAHYAGSLGDAPHGSVWVTAGGHNDSSANGTWKFNLKTGTWSSWKPNHTPVYREPQGGFESETTRGTFLNLAAYNDSQNAVITVGSTFPDPTAIYGVPGQPGSTHSYSHMLIIPPGIIPGTSGPCHWRQQAGMGWTQARRADYPYYYSDLADSANPWMHLSATPQPAGSPINGSAYYNGKVYVFDFQGTVADVVDLATGEQTFFTHTSMKNGSGWVYPYTITEGGRTFFLFCTGNYNGGTVTSPTLRLMEAPGSVSPGALYTVLASGVVGWPMYDSANAFYYSPCWSPDRRAVYFCSWKDDLGGIASGGTSTVIFKATAPADIRDPWTLSSQNVNPYLTPDTGSQMRPRSFWVNGCVVNFPAVGSPVQAIGVD
jgi:hypothetical protein